MSSVEKELDYKTTPFGRRLKEAFNNDSNKAMSLKLGIGKSTITSYMQGRIPTSEKLIEIADLTGCNLNWLLTGIGSKFVIPQQELPQGLIIQASKGGGGTSTSAIMIAANLALRGFKVLFTCEEGENAHWNFFFGKDYISARQTQKIKAEEVEKELYIQTKNKNLDLFIPIFRTYPSFKQNLVNPFDFDISQINQKYDFVVFDVRKFENPFFYPYYSIPSLFSLEPIIRRSKVLIPFQPFVSSIRNVESTIRCIAPQKRIYPEAEFLGVFFLYLRQLYKYEKLTFNQEMEKLRNIFGMKLFETSVEYHSEMQKSPEKLERIIFSRKTGIYTNFSMLVDEILDKIRYPKHK